MKTTSMVSKTLVMAVLMLLFSCGNASKKEAKTAEKPAMEHSEHQMTQAEANLGPEFTSKYVCPMHCKGSGSHEEGKCPVCGMTYVLNEDYQEESEENHKH
jgi:hypothetical protein